MVAGIVVAVSSILTIIIVAAAVRSRRSERHAALSGRPDLCLRLAARGSMASTINDLLNDVGAALKHLFSRGFEQTRISDSVKHDAGEMVAAADKTKKLAEQVSASMHEMSTTVAEISRTVNKTAHTLDPRRGED